MIAYPDTSFLCALYREQTNSDLADLCFQRLTEPLAVTQLLLAEFRQSVRFQIGLHNRDRTRGFSTREGLRMLVDLEDDLHSGALETFSADWSEVFNEAERLSITHTINGIHRFTDILHVATALHFGAKEFLTFDANQIKLVKSEGMKVPV